MDVAHTLSRGTVACLQGHYRAPADLRHQLLCLAQPSEVESHESASEHILKELQRIIASQERIEGRFSALHAEVKAEVQEMHAEVTAVTAEVQQVRGEVTTVKAEVQQVRAEVLLQVQVGRAEMDKWRAEMERTVRAVELNEAQSSARSN